MDINQDIIKHISIDCVLFGFREGELEVLLIELNDEIFRSLMKSQDGLSDFWKGHIDNYTFNGQQSHNLLGGHVRLNKGLYQNAHDIVSAFIDEDKQKFYLKQLGTFGELDRVPFDRVITVVYYSLLNPSNFILKKQLQITLKWHKLSALPNDLRFDHTDLIMAALEKLRDDIRTRPVGFYLLPEKFTLTELQKLYENILNKTLDTRNFRKKLQKLDLLIDTGEMQQDVAYRAAKLYKFDKVKYDKLSQDGFEFRI